MSAWDNWPDDYEALYDDAYEPSDPKSDGYADRMFERADTDRKRLKEEGPVALLSSDCERCGEPLDEGGCPRCGATIDLRKHRP